MVDGITGVTEMIWQPIETAPTDGTIIMGYNKKRKHFYLVKWGKWDKNDAWICNSKGSKLTLTHWMELPEEPQ